MTDQDKILSVLQKINPEIMAIRGQNMRHHIPIGIDHGKEGILIPDINTEACFYFDENGSITDFQLTID